MWTCTSCGTSNAEDTNNFCGRCGQARGDRDHPSFDLYLTSFDASRKISLIKEVREVSSYGLKEAKDLVEHAPQLFSCNLTRADAERIGAQLQAAGAQIEICAHGTPPSKPVNPLPQPAASGAGCTGMLLVLLSVASSIVLVWGWR